MFDEFLRALSPKSEEILTKCLSKIKDTQRNQKLREDLISRFFSLLLTDDERAEVMNLPTGCRIRENAKIISPENFKCGDYVWIGENAILDASGGLEVGSHTSVGLGVYIWSHHSILPNVLGENVIASKKIIRKSTKIGSGCFIGGHAVINPGVSIGDKVVILPMTVVTRDVPSNSVVRGAPAKVVATVDDAFIEQLSTELKTQKPS